MSQDRNPYYPPSAPAPYSPYSNQAPIGFNQYPPDRNFAPYPPPPMNNINPPPYVHSTPAGYEPNSSAPQTSYTMGDTQPDGWGKFTGLESKQIRAGFIRKVYSILTVQLLITFGIVIGFHYSNAVRSYIRSPGGQWLYYSSYAVFLVTYLTLACCRNVGRRYPMNLVLLSLLTLSMAFMMAMISSYFTINSIFIAVGITSFVCLGVTLFSFQTKYDFTSCFGVLFVISLALFAFGIVCAFTYSKILHTVYAGLGAVAFSVFLAVDTQLIMGGKRHEISAEDHVFASIMLYLDIVYIFMYILMLVGKRE